MQSSRLVHLACCFAALALPLCSMQHAVFDCLLNRGIPRDTSCVLQGSSHAQVGCLSAMAQTCTDLACCFAALANVETVVGDARTQRREAVAPGTNTQRKHTVQRMFTLLYSVGTMFQLCQLYKLLWQDCLVQAFQACNFHGSRSFNCASCFGKPVWCKRSTYTAACI